MPSPGGGLAALVVFQGASPMAQRRSMASDTESYYIEKSQEIMGEDAGFVYEPGEEIPPQVLEKLRTLYTQVFGKEGLYHATLLGDLIDKFGVDAVMGGLPATPPTARPSTTCAPKRSRPWSSPGRGRTLSPACWASSMAESYIGENNYDPETDFHALLFFYGYGGAALYLAFCAWFPLLALWQLVKHRRRFWQYPWVPAGTFLLQLALGIWRGAAVRLRTAPAQRHRVPGPGRGPAGPLPRPLGPGAKRRLCRRKKYGMIVSC